MKWYPVVLLSLFVSMGYGQRNMNTARIRGIVQDKMTKEVLIGASIMIPNSSIGTISDDHGAFVLDQVPVGRVELRCEFLGYEPYHSESILMTSAKEMYIEIFLNQGSIQTNEVIITASKNAFEAVNPLSVVSTRSFTVEETDRIAAGINDPGRVALSFPGVKQGPDESENTIIVRGNSPVGILWRLEGIDVPNPNHFALIGGATGGINVFSAQLLSRSDFSTGGLAAEYGNSIASAFDIHFRPGNFEKTEHRFKVGLIGLDFATEGPINTGKSSYLVNYRYSTLGILDKLGFHLVGDRVTNNFQDLSFNLTFKGNNPKFKTTVFGFGGLSLEEHFPVSDAGKRDPILFDNREFQHKPNNVGVLGATFTYLPDHRSYFKAVIALMGSQAGREKDTVNNENVYARYHTEHFNETRLSASLTYNNKLNNYVTIKTGLMAHQVFFNFDRNVQQLSSIGNINVYELGGSVSGRGNTQILQQYSQAIFQFNSRFSANVGYHYLRLNANSTSALDPRISFQYLPAVNQRIGLSFGIQSQTLPLMSYYFRDSTLQYVNRNLKLLQSSQWVLAYHLFTRNKMKLSFEGYYQHLAHVPVRQDVHDDYWMLNSVDGYPTFKVVSDGKGINYGIDAAIEKLFTHSYFLLLTGSALKSTFNPLSGKTYSTNWDSRFTSSITSGKEFDLKNGKVFQIGGRILWSGNTPYSPLDVDASRIAGRYIPLKDATNTGRIPNYYRMDARMQYRYNHNKRSGSISLDIQNTLNHINATGVGYDVKTNSTYVVYKGGNLVPVIAFQVDF